MAITMPIIVGRIAPSVLTANCTNDARIRRLAPKHLHMPVTKTLQVLLLEGIKALRLPDEGFVPNLQSTLSSLYGGGGRMKKSDRLWTGVAAGLALSIVLASLVTVTLSGAVGMELADSYEYSIKCDEASHPFKSKIIDGQCHYATTYGWAKLPLD